MREAKRQTKIYLDESVFEWLAAEAVREGLSTTGLVRRLCRAEMRRQARRGR